MRKLWLPQSRTVVPDWNLKQLLLCLQNRGMTLGPFIHLSTQNPIPLQASGKGVDPSFSPIAKQWCSIWSSWKQPKNHMQAIWDATWMLQSSAHVKQTHVLISPHKFDKSSISRIGFLMDSLCCYDYWIPYVVIGIMALIPQL